jgi:hypothetical protein
MLVLYHHHKNYLCFDGLNLKYIVCICGIIIINPLVLAMYANKNSKNRMQKLDAKLGMVACACNPST